MGKITVFLPRLILEQDLQMGIMVHTLRGNLNVFTVLLFCTYQKVTSSSVSLLVSRENNNSVQMAGASANA